MNIVRIGGKVRDMGFLYLMEKREERSDTIAGMDDDYMPYIDFLCGGDEILIDIDNETGTILGWRPLTEADFQDEQTEEID